MMKHIKFFEMCSVALILACLRTCSCEEKSSKDLQTDFFSKCFEDKTISIVRTRRLYSCDPVRWENPIPYDEGVFEKPEYMSMSNMYAIVSIDSNADEWVFKRGAAECLFFKEDMANIEDFCVYNVKSDTLQPCDGGTHCSFREGHGSAHVADEVVDLEKLFNSHKSCPCIFFGNGRKGVLFWRGGLDSRWRHCFTTLLWVGRPYDYYTVKKFKTWDDFLAWDGVMQKEDGK